jgi:hypothetical protein
MTQVKEAVKVSAIFFVCLTIVLLSITGGVAYYYGNDRVLMSKNVSEAIEKGIDPLSVRCSYASQSDTVCVAYAYSKQGKTSASDQPVSIKK